MTLQNHTAQQLDGNDLVVLGEFLCSMTIDDIEDLSATALK